MMSLCMFESMSAEKHVEEYSDVDMLLEEGGGVGDRGKLKQNVTLDFFCAVGCGWW